MPLTGVTFPFVSYGGSSLLVSAVSIGLVNNMYINDQISKQPK
ncbi:MAG TPA: FtsW/RodA/SpoVE family cell cycle protein [Trichococcus flocculiformis]|nr:FtsW/RodA/SpoVE family cell cycle protein [Trichococcus flocculiformis]